MPSPLPALPVWGEAQGSTAPLGILKLSLLGHEVPALRETLPVGETLAGPPSHVDWAMLNED